MAKYAEHTTVSTSRSRDEIERTLQRFGATGFGWMRDSEAGVITLMFKKANRTYKFTLSMPSINEFEVTPSGKWTRTAEKAQMAQEAEIRRRFRSLANYIKALMDAVDTGIVVMEEALLPYLVLSQGRTFYQEAKEQLHAGSVINLPQLGGRTGEGNDQ